MMKKVIFVSAISGGILFWSIHLQADNFDCRNAETQTEINQCAYQDFQQKDEELSQIYQQYYANYYQGGSLAPMVYSSCLKDKTIERINDLKNYIALY
ncbi:lysozyme inhibitor LprI family protein [Proteus mirabilis]|uniref:lysozyme inhibitor LprI family protein n=2 Tax=Morganellaceae TaxID=1903414 RepID=UPI001F5B5C0C|nr:lysozyme inhibitor LprI family protein [Proteus mirabilis]